MMKSVKDDFKYDKNYPFTISNSHFIGLTEKNGLPLGDELKNVLIIDLDTATESGAYQLILDYLSLKKGVNYAQ